MFRIHSRLFFNKIKNVIIYNQRSKIRKILNDWNLGDVGVGKLYRVIATVIFIIMILLFGITSYATITVIPSISSKRWISVIFTLYVMFSLLRAFNFYPKNKSIFYYDTSKILNQNKGFRILQVISTMLGDSLKFSVISWLVIFFPIVLSLYIFNDGINPLRMILYTPVIFFLHLSITMTFTYIHFSLARLLYINTMKYLSNIVTFLLVSFMLFVIPYIVSSLFINSALFTEQVLPIITQHQGFLSKLDIFLYSFFELNSIGLFLTLITAALCSYLSIIAWKKTLEYLDLITYYEINDISNKTEYKEKLLKTNSHFLVKDTLYIKRMNAWFLGHVAKTILGVIAFIGLAFPVIQRFISLESPIFILTVVTVFTFAVFQLIGDSLRMILAIDGESNNIHLFINQGYTLWDVIKQKMIIYTAFTLIITFIINLILLIIIGLDVLTLLLSLLIISSFGVLSGIFQLATTGLYPRVNWEHPYEIGNSHKASSLNNVLNNSLIFVYTLFVGSLFIIDQFLPITLTLAMVSLLFVILTLFAITFYVMSLYLKRFTVKEVFIKND